MKRDETRRDGELREEADAIPLLKIGAFAHVTNTAWASSSIIETQRNLDAEHKDLLENSSSGKQQDGAGKVFL